MMLSRQMSFIYILFILSYVTYLVSSQSQCPKGLRVRRNFLSLTLQERKAYASAFLEMKKSDFIDKMVAKHRKVPHGTTWFLPVHRAMLLEFENELIRVSNGVVKALPYWDELADSNNPRGSRIFSSEGVGILANGNLRAPFLGLTDDSDRVMVRRNPPPNVSGQFAWAPASQLVARSLVRFRSFGQLSSSIEVVPHNRYHVLIGGNMGIVTQAPSDPVFWLHHSYTDLLWATWQATAPDYAENLQVDQTQLVIKRNDQIPLYTYTALDTLRHRTRLCYTYEQTSPSGISRLMRRDISTNINNTNTDENFDPVNAPINDPRTIKDFPKLISLTEEQWKQWMPNISMENVAEVEKAYSDLIDEVNKLIKDDKIDPSKMEIIDDLVKNIATNTSLVDDGQDTGIPEVAGLAQQQKSNAISYYYINNGWWPVLSLFVSYIWAIHHMGL